MCTRALIACCLLVSISCASYQPQAPGIHVTANGFRARFFKDGKQLDVGPALGGLEDAMADVPAAASEAHSAHVDLLTANGFLIGMLGLFTSSIVVAAGHSRNRDDIATGLLLGGLALEVAGISFMTAGRASASNALNIYNDVAIPRAYAPTP